jgi:hypothetical protein
MQMDKAALSTGTLFAVTEQEPIGQPRVISCLHDARSFATL